MSYEEEIGERLKKLRENTFKPCVTSDGVEKEKKMSQEDFIKLLDLGMTQSNLSNIENGKGITFDILIKYSEYYNISLDTLITGKDFSPFSKTINDPTFADIFNALEFVFSIYPLDNVIFKKYTKENNHVALNHSACTLIFKENTPIINYLKSKLEIEKCSDILKRTSFKNSETYQEWHDHTAFAAKYYNVQGVNSLSEKYYSYLVQSKFDCYEEEEASLYEKCKVDFLDNYRLSDFSYCPFKE